MKILRRLPMGLKNSILGGEYLFVPGPRYRGTKSEFSYKAIKILARDSLDGGWLAQLKEDPQTTFKVQFEQLKESVERDLEDFL